MGQGGQHLLQILTNIAKDLIYGNNFIRVHLLSIIKRIPPLLKIIIPKFFETPSQHVQNFRPPISKNQKCL